jgi:hypothetical protein
MAASTSLTPSEKSLRASLASDASWANTLDRTARSQPGRDAMQRKFEAQCAAAIGENNWATLTPAEQAKRVENARRAYFKRLALRSAIARRRRREAAEGGDDGAT